MEWVVDVLYIPNFWPIAVEDLHKAIPWEQRDTARAECFMSDPTGISYSYGKAGFERTYVSVETPMIVKEACAVIEVQLGVRLPMCFVNRYDSEKNHVGWHSDDSPIIDQTKPIAVLSLGAEREIWFKHVQTGEVQKLLLGHGSLAVMPAGMQATHQHRIPKGSRACGMRISLTLRGVPDA